MPIAGGGPGGEMAEPGERMVARCARSGGGGGIAQIEATRALTCCLFAVQEAPMSATSPAMAPTPNVSLMVRNGSKSSNPTPE